MVNATLTELKELVKLKNENPKKYKRLTKDISEVACDLTRLELTLLKDFLKEFKSKLDSRNQKIIGSYSGKNFY